MSDIFVSYARPNERQARQIADALRQRGYSVWRDDELPAHRAYSEVIEERIKSAKAVVVLWSAEAAKSQWVRAEADAAREAGTLVQVTLDGSIPPMPFNQIQCADLSNWAGDTTSQGWQKVEASISLLSGAAATADNGGAHAAASPSSRKLSVCVLPFVNMSGDAEQEYFSDGISEDIITDLSKISAVSVVARNTAFTYKGKVLDVKEVLRATTDKAETFDKSVMMSSLMPSLKYSCSGSPLMFTKGRTQIDIARSSGASAGLVEAFATAAVPAVLAMASSSSSNCAVCASPFQAPSSTVWN
jgi:hypothetical protein